MLISVTTNGSSNKLDFIYLITLIKCVILFCLFGSWLYYLFIFLLPLLFFIQTSLQDIRLCNFLHDLIENRLNNILLI